MERISSKYFLEYKPAESHEVDAGKLGNALLGLKDGITKVCKAERDLENIEVNVIANKPGSFIVDLIVAITVATTANLVAEKLSGKLKTFTNQFRIKKFAKGSDLKAIPKFGNTIELKNKDEESIEVSPEDYEVHRSKIIDKDISKVVEALEEEKITALRTGIPNTDYIESVDIKEKPYFIPQEAGELPELEDQKEVFLDGEIISFNKKRKTIGFVYKDTIVNCKPASGKNIVEFVEFAKFTNVKLHGQVHRPEKDKPPIIYIESVDYTQPPLMK